MYLTINENILSINDIIKYQAQSIRKHATVTNLYNHEINFACLTCYTGAPSAGEYMSPQTQWKY